MIVTDVADVGINVLPFLQHLLPDTTGSCFVTI